ncbi:MAG: hypothetical protein J8272_00675, partial ['Prunus persica' phytoplasma PP2]|nr:hypothetical protein ['Prunus persica' phytoplasma PP2]
KILPNAKLLFLTADFSHSKSDSDYFHSTAIPNWPLKQGFTISLSLSLSLSQLFFFVNLNLGI